jgi:glycine/D-amino acid oxidase-like deaminating enzyme
VGVSTAYFLSRHTLFNPNLHSIILLEAGKLAGGASGKGGGFIADQAIPKSIAPLSFKLHGQLAKEHGGDKVWGYRTVHAAEIKLLARNLDGNDTTSEVTTPKDASPSGLDWLFPGSVKAYDEIGTRDNSGQVNPFMFTTTLAKLAEEKGVDVRTNSTVSKINLQHNDGVMSVTFGNGDNWETIDARG